jgi:hypothetical protein
MIARDADSQTASRDGEWKPTGSQMAVWQLGGAVGLVFAFPLFLKLASLFDGGGESGRTNVFSNATVIRTFDEVAVGFLLLVPVLILHEICHGAGFHMAGAKPRYGLKLVGGMPCLYAAAPGRWLTRWQYVLVGIAPTIVVNVAGLILMAGLPDIRHALVWSLSMHFCGCIGDWTFLRRVLKLPPATEFEDAEGTGFRYRLGQAP